MEEEYPPIDKRQASPSVLFFNRLCCSLEEALLHSDVWGLFVINLDYG